MPNLFCRQWESVGSHQESMNAYENYRLFTISLIIPRIFCNSGKLLLVPYTKDFGIITRFWGNDLATELFAALCYELRSSNLFQAQRYSFICKSETYFCMKMEVVKPICLYMILSTWHLRFYILTQTFPSTSVTSLLLIICLYTLRSE